MLILPDHLPRRSPAWSPRRRFDERLSRWMGALWPPGFKFTPGVKDCNCNCGASKQSSSFPACFQSASCACCIPDVLHATVHANDSSCGVNNGRTYTTTLGKQPPPGGGVSYDTYVWTSIDGGFSPAGCGGDVMTVTVGCCIANCILQGGTFTPPFWTISWVMNPRNGFCAANSVPGVSLCLGSAPATATCNPIIIFANSIAHSGDSGTAFCCNNYNITVTI
jgi:hypothetical protein